MGLKSMVPTVVRGGEAKLQQLTAAIAQEVPRKGYSAAQTYMLTQQAGPIGHSKLAMEYEKRHL